MQNNLEGPILVTGANGFVGQAVIAALVERRHETFALARNQTIAAGSMKSNHKKIIAPTEEWSEVISGIRPKTLILCDWEGLTALDRNDHAIQNQNIRRWISLASAARRNGVRRITGIGSQAEIGEHQENAGSNTFLEPTEVYGKAKVEILNYLSEMSRESNINFDWARIFSLYGESAKSSWLIPKVISSILAKKQLLLTGCEQEWNFLHVSDAADAILTVLENSPKNIPINIANPETIILRDVIDYISNRMQGAEYLKFGGIPYPENQVMRMKPNVKELLSLGWLPRRNLFMTIDAMIRNATQEHE